jgi:membrane protease YdiL (CAAX protease family)
MRILEAITPRRFTLLALGCELFLGGLGLLLSWRWGRWPLPMGDSSWPWGWHVALGVLCALPLLGGLFWMERHPVGMLRELMRVVAEEVVPLFRDVSVPGLLAISLAAGVGEELLFRGFLQATLTDLWSGPVGILAGLLIASLVFGLCHALCWGYAVVATAMGLLLGLLFLATGSLWAPMTTHAVYDFCALVHMLRRDRALGA